MILIARPTRCSARRLNFCSGVSFSGTDFERRRLGLALGCGWLVGSVLGFSAIVKTPHFVKVSE